MNRVSARGIGGILLFALLPALVSWGWHWHAGLLPKAGASVERVSVGRLPVGAEVLWVDARPVAAYEEEHIPGALSLNEESWSAQLPAVLDRWQPAMTVIVYCGSESCHASEAVAQRLMRETGWTNVRVLEGGWEAWKNDRSSR
jgi:rhodanese-related sulfurtransferase